MNTFGNIPKSDIRGLRMPLLQLSGNNQFTMMKEGGIEYDSSWPTRSFMQTGLWPYTLDYQSIQDCNVLPCPDESIPGQWVLPMIMWEDTEGYPCSMVDACGYQ